MILPRLLETKLKTELIRGKKGVVIYGPRQVGKTTLVNKIIANLGYKTLILNGDQRGAWWESLTSRDLAKIKLLVSGYEAVFIDEAQRIPEIGLNLKIILDNFPGLRVVVTGSSSLDLASKISEPLTGRVYTYKLLPISQGELSLVFTPLEREEQREERLVFGAYPEIFSLESAAAKSEYLRQISTSYLYKDLLEFGDIRNSSKIHDLLKLLAFQIGSQVSLTELAVTLEISRVTVDRYIDLLEKSFIVFRLSGFSRNQRKEVSKMDKIYFYDTGIRNALIDDFKLLNNRNDAAKLWENFLIVERIKKLGYIGSGASHYFWRLTSGAEIDMIEEGGGDLAGYELKYSVKTPKAPASWRQIYPQASFSAVNFNNWQKFVS